MKYTLPGVILIIQFLTSSCHIGSETSTTDPYSEYDTVEVKPAFNRLPIFTYMDSKYQPFSPMLSKDTIPRKATSAVTIVELADSRDRIHTTDELACEATISNDTLWITNGFSTGFSGAGVSIQVAGNKFRALPYKFYDVIIEDEKEPVIRIEKQKLIVNKATYQVGDSLFGYLYVRTQTLGTDTRTYAQGHFRTIVKKQ